MNMATCKMSKGGILSQGKKPKTLQAEKEDGIFEFLLFRENCYVSSTLSLKSWTDSGYVKKLIKI